MLIHGIMMLQEKIMKERMRDRRDVPDAEARDAIAPGTLPVTMGAQEEEIPARTGVSRPYTIAARHERRRSS
jgi:hypothetical protein